MVRLLDTNTCVAIIRHEPKALERYRQTLPSEVVVPWVVCAELFYGAYLSQEPQKNLRKVRNFLAPLGTPEADEGAAVTYGRIRSDLRSQGQTMGSNNVIIAAVALAGSFTLVTHNTKEFSRVHGLNLEDWLI